jgi:cytosine/adenosine deaminase-related metal-dependent hydrolase
MHLAESSDERELLQTQTGPLRRLLDELGVWRRDAIPFGTTSMDYLRVLAGSPHSLVIHGNYLTEREMDFVAANRDRMAIVFCPRTHVYFGHDTYPLPTLLRRGIRVALGTDSRASNPDLALGREVACAARLFPSVSPKQFLHMATIDGAESLCVANDYGSISPGKIARLALVDCPANLRSDPAAAWLQNIENARPFQPTENLSARV